MSAISSGAQSKLWSTVALGKLDANLTPDQKSELRALQIGAVMALAPIMILVNLFNISVVGFLLWEPQNEFFVGAWMGLSLALLGVWAFNVWRGRGRTARLHASSRGVRRVAVSALFFGAIWAAPVVVLFPHATEMQRAILIACAAGMVAGGALILATIWQAALAYGLAVEIPTAIVLVLSGEPIYLGLAALSLSFTGAIARTVHERGRLFVQNYLTSLDLRDQGQVISLLLKEFEETASDWLFEVDAHGLLTRVTNRHAQLVGRSVEELNGMSVFTLLTQAATRSSERRDPAVSRLVKAFLRQEPFRDLELCVHVNGENRCWSLTGKPMLDTSGAFTGYRGVGSDITEAKRAEASIERMARYDALTGLPNRSLLGLRLAHAVDRMRRHGGGFAILSIDLDRFKNVNDTLGHQTGDLLLGEVARRIVDNLRDDDVVARFGGDEFVVLQAAPGRKSDAGALADRLVAALAAPYDINGHRILIGASVGIAVAPEHGEHPDELVRNSDLALYRAKSDGKGRYAFYAAEMDAIVQSRRLLELDLRDALDRRALEVFFQPLIEVTSGRISSCEALVRWNHPTRGYIPPGEFIPLAEETALIVALGEFVLRTACAEAAGWSRDLGIAVNLSALQFQAGDLVGLVRKVLDETGLAPHRLELEITESILIEDKVEVLRILAALRETGVRISLDDFGTGYSSLAYLSSFPFDKIKIDRSFVRDVDTRADSAAIIRAITSLAATFGMCTTAEGVEQVEELDWLRSHGCEQAQGFLFSKPVPARDLRLLLGLAHAAQPWSVEPSGVEARRTAA